MLRKYLEHGVQRGTNQRQQISKVETSGGSPVARPSLSRIGMLMFRCSRTLGIRISLMRIRGRVSDPRSRPIFSEDQTRDV